MLPKINAHSSYQIKIPSTNENVHFRPYLVKEEKILLLSIESGETSQILRTIGETVQACIKEPIELNDLTSYDIEYLFTKIRSKSVGEKTLLMKQCDSCEKEFELTINIDNIKIKKPNNQIVSLNLTDTIEIIFKEPSFVDIINAAPMNDDHSKTEQMFTMLKSCIKSVKTEEENILISDVSDDDFNAFIEDLTSAQYNAIMQFVEDLPSMVYTDTVKCEHCNKSNEIKLEGMQDFF